MTLNLWEEGTIPVLRDPHVWVRVREVYPDDESNCQVNI